MRVKSGVDVPSLGVPEELIAVELPVSTGLAVDVGCCAIGHLASTIDLLYNPYVYADGLISKFCMSVKIWIAKNGECA